MGTSRFASPALVLMLGVGAVILAACGGTSTAGSETDQVTGAPAMPSDTSQPTGDAEAAPSVLALEDIELQLEGEAGAEVSAGETVELSHLVYNRSPGARSVTFRVQNADLDASLPVSSVRVGSQEVLLVTTVVTIPEDASIGQAYSYELSATISTDLAQRAVAVVSLVVTEASGSRPSVGSNSGSTQPNEELVVYVLNAARDPDGDLDVSSLRIVAGGFKSSDVAGAADGTITYLPFLDVSGDDVVLYELCDSEGRCDSGALDIVVSG